MSEPESKKLEALWDWAVALTRYRHANATDTEEKAAAKRLLALSVLAEEAPPVKDDPGACTYDSPCPSCAPAPKQESELPPLYPGCIRCGYTGQIQQLRNALREERAASEEEAARRGTRILELRAENASLREKVARAVIILGPQENGPDCECRNCRALP